MVDYPIIGNEVKAIGTPTTDTRLVGTGLTIAQGEPLYIDTASDTWRKAAAGLSVEAAQATHIALSAGADGQQLIGALLQRGLILDLGAGAAVPIAALVVLSANAGRQAPSTDLVTGNFSTYLGTGIGNNQVLYNVNASGVQVP